MILEKICQFFFRQHTEDIIGDIDDGTLMKHLKQESKFLSVPEHAGLVLCCDGVPVFKSSGMIIAMYTFNIIKIIYKLLGQTLWPVLMFTTSLPPTNRMNAEKIMVGALWLGPCKPPMQILMPPVLSKIEKRQTTGIQFQASEGIKTLKGKLLVGVFDQPAKAMVLNVVQFNGYYGCPYCLDKGVTSHIVTFICPRNHIYLRFKATSINGLCRLKKYQKQSMVLRVHLS